MINEQPPAPVSDISGRGFGIIEKSIEQCFPDVTVVPSLMVGNTDSRHFWGIAKAHYRFRPTQLDKGGSYSTKMFHGRNERIRIDNLAKSVLYYRQVIVNADVKC